MPLAFPSLTAARDYLDDLLLLGGQPTVENLLTMHAEISSYIHRTICGE